MSKENLTITFSVDQSPEAVFAAIKNVSGWWSEGVEGPTDVLGKEFTYRHKDIHYSKHKLTELVAAQKIVWLVTDAYLSFPEDKTEWKGTSLCFEIAKKGDKTEVRFTHLGLAPAHECFDRCSKAWGFYVGESLRALITTGQGKPDPKSYAAR